MKATEIPSGEVLYVSFSGGRTSAYMSMLCVTHLSHLDLRFVFMNTGLEHEKTLAFVDKCDKHFGLDLTWIEAVAHPGEKKASTHKITNFENAARKGEPYMDITAKYGVSNPTWQACTRELKSNPQTSLRRSRNHLRVSTALGMRVDEIDRMSPDAKQNRLVYPLISDWPTRKIDVLSYWAKQPFDLDLPEHLGNCVGCWKKSWRKLSLVAKEMPEAFDFFIEAEARHGKVGVDDSPDKTGRKFYRKHTSAVDVRNSGGPVTSDLFEDVSPCEEHCEAFS